MALRASAKPTLTALELDPGEALEFRLAGGGVRELAVEAPWARILFTTLDRPGVEARGARTFYRFGCRLWVAGETLELTREVPTMRSFYEPWELAGVRVWLDAVDAIFSFLNETHGPCRPRKAVRLALQDASLRLCPAPVHPWCPLRRDGMDINDCYCGEDCWLGAYFGASAHGGLDLNHPPGTPIWAPIDLDDHAYFNSLAMGHNNNRWRGFRTWPDGSRWTLQCHHMTRLTIAEHTPLRAGQQYADGAGVLSGYHDHSHFVFRVAHEGEDVLLDPWILFWQMYRDRVAYPGPAWR